ncbi:UNKNOWN [Stylonychia lemnae]|uniref:Uncharacterized protein n=1 Tax=Stylonychia lemnae TaxID=5949 RepID=A0A078AC56_STYLE|nr:UNKNOWN [Stylonychia lemnae]|eukprot:CDW79799.1 UNKNOWN [Stylonychia lemnae]
MLAQIIGLKGLESTRKEIQDTFIEFAIDKGIVDMSTRQYEIFKVPYLKEKFQTDYVGPQEIFAYLKKLLVQINN